MKYEMKNKKCACGRVHDRARWESLEYVGKMPAYVSQNSGEGETEAYFILRNCECQSTLTEFVGSVRQYAETLEE